MKNITSGRIVPTTISITDPATNLVHSRSGKLVYFEDRIYFIFGYWALLNSEIKNMAGYKYHGYDDKDPAKVWSVVDNSRNRFALSYLSGGNPYSRYDAPLKPLENPFFTTLYGHQKLEFVPHFLQRKGCVLAGEMGTGKTLSVFEALIQLYLASLLKGDIWYVAPKSVLAAISYDMDKWNRWAANYQNHKISIPKMRLMSYENLVKTIKGWIPGSPAPQVLILDESSRIKTPDSQRSQAAFQTAEGVRHDWGENGYVWAMSGTPAPRTPLDWWHQAEVACPGFLKEGNIHLLKQRLAIVVDAENPMTMQKYPQLKAWRDDERKCNICGQLPEVHDAYTYNDDNPHAYVPSKNEVALLYKRLSGLVLVKFKRDCLDLPEKQFRFITLEPTQQLKNLAQALKHTSSRAIEALISIRELSDGFQYVNVKVGSETCKTCGGTGKLIAPDEAKTVYDCSCEGGVTNIYERQITEIPTPKDELYIDLLDQHWDIGRFVVYADFTASIDKLCKIAKENQWSVIRVDGRGWLFEDPAGNVISDPPLKAFQEMQEKYPQIVFVGHPQSAGMGLTLTASPTAFFYSPGFNAEAYIQACDRIHRPGMDVNRGATIIGVLMLPTDKLVYDNLQKKRDLQAMTMGDLRAVLDTSLEAGPGLNALRQG